MLNEIFLSRQRYAIKMLDKLSEMEPPAFVIVASGYVNGSPVELREEVLASDPRVIARLLQKAYDKYERFIDPECEQPEETGEDEMGEGIDDDDDP